MKYQEILNQALKDNGAKCEIVAVNINAVHLVEINSPDTFYTYSVEDAVRMSSGYGAEEWFIEDALNGNIISATHEGWFNINESRKESGLEPITGDIYNPLMEEYHSLQDRVLEELRECLDVYVDFVLDEESMVSLENEDETAIENLIEKDNYIWLDDNTRYYLISGYDGEVYGVNDDHSFKWIRVSEIVIIDQINLINLINSIRYA